MTRQKRSPTPAVIDACCLIDLLSSGQAEAILRAAGCIWHLPDAVRGEVQYIRQHDPAQPGSVISIPVDLTSIIARGLLTLCQPDDAQEQARFVHYAGIFRSDGEAMYLALAESRGWVVATDDRKAIRIAGQAGLTVISCPQIIKAWADAIHPDPAMIAGVLADIQTLAKFVPNPMMPEAPWWYRKLNSP